MCHSPSKEGPCTAKALLRHLLVNPPSLTTDLPPLQSVPLTVTVQVKDIRVYLLVETVEADHDNTAPEELGYTVGMLYLTSLQVERAFLYHCAYMCSMAVTRLPVNTISICMHSSHPKELKKGMTRSLIRQNSFTKQSPNL